MPITQQQLLQILPNASPVAGVFVSALNTAMGKYQIITPLRIAAFLAQAGHESGQLLHLVENLNYGATGLLATWPDHFTAALAAQVARQPEAIANIAYGSRMGNGPTQTGDGWKYRGRGLFQVTGWAGYQACGSALALDLLNHPELLEQPIYAAMSAAWYWSTKGFNTLADAGNIDDIGSIINTGQRGRVPNGAADRAALYNTAMGVLA
ncbi:glycoside hydrolase family 19 protein [Pseudomonas sp. CCI3.2]|uniref:glycoside hydrolase family 19 protein n=1 Tax=unclassified Pseudomonas TaxID=196821 RepID=UPI002B23019F|nr:MULTISPECIES: glycoside hydrolase family 19 protein [unclassified Pseudomonas]MEB0077995.1 glycoside hydrolase family 19 protein [Pseudomonas sp. MH10out]MEB0104333.1 glycoside hydrolase family 19 protein [Pseudomonas sp. CCI3.2]MEB0132661.1 glycoside hydrolase family 19 protein [Pseudomonas sp. CCI2.4]